MNDFFAAAISVSVIVAVFAYGYFSDPYRTRRAVAIKTVDNRSVTPAQRLKETWHRSSDVA